jgi:hypothetical protein
MFLRLLRFALLCLVCVVMPTTARAQRTTMVLGVDTPGSLTGQRARLHRELREGVEQSGVYVVHDASDMLLDEVEAVMACDEGLTPTCLASFAEFVDAEYLLWGTLEAGDGAPVLDVVLFEARTRTRTRQWTLEVPPSRGPHALPVRLAGLLGDAPVVEIRSARPAQVWIDGVPRGAAPLLTAELQPGPHEVLLNFGDGSSQSAMLSVPRSGFLSVDVADLLRRRGERTATGSQLTRRRTGWAMLGAAVAMGTVAALQAARAAQRETELALAPTQRDAWRLADQGRSATRAANALGFGGLVFGGVGGFLLWSGRSQGAASPTP